MADMSLRVYVRALFAPDGIANAARARMSKEEVYYTHLKNKFAYYPWELTQDIIDAHNRHREAVIEKIGKERNL